MYVFLWCCHTYISTIHTYMAIYHTYIHIYHTYVCTIHTYVAIYHIAIYHRAKKLPYIHIWQSTIRTRGGECLDLQIIQFSWILFWVTGTPFTHGKTCLKFWGLPRKRVWYVRALLWKLDGNLGSRNYFKSDLLRLWIPYCNLPYTGWLRLVGSLRL